MKKLKKILPLVVATSLLTVGCAKEVPVAPGTPETNTNTEANAGEANKIVPEEGAELLLWTDKLAYGEAIVEGFNKLYPDVKVTTEEVGFTDARKKMELDGPAGTGADVFMISHSRLNSAIASGMVSPITGDVEERLKEKLSDAAIRSASYDGILYGAPVSTEAAAIFYNKDIVGENPATTFEEIFEFAKTFNDPANNKFAFMMSIADSYSAYSFLSSYGFQLFGPEGADADNPGFDSEAFVKGLEFVQSLREVLPVQSADLKGEFVNEQFKQGKAAYIYGGPWNIKDFTEAGVNFGVMTMPTIEGNTPTPFAGLKVAHVSAYTDYPNASMLLTEFMASEEGARILYETNYKATALKDISGVPGLAEDEHLSVFTKQFAQAFPVPNQERMDYYYSIGEKTLALVFDGQLSPQDAAAKAVEEWNSLVASE